jgi:cytochrome c oxidase cbb3-type subunit 3
MTAYRLATTALLVLALLTMATYVRSETPAQQPSPAEQQSIPPAIQYKNHISAGGVAPAGGSLTNPHKGEKATAEAGASLFSGMNCDGCHGGGALGWAAPSLADGRWRYGGDEDDLFQSIFYGRPKGMPAYGAVLGTNGVWVLVTYLQSLKVPADVPTQSWETP